mmetsp:Transcript_2175/g.5406  ORF Transcript_2175/g.5406 Transcript_2175/m.5406 type:complete len:274 (+) Transcript_2175:537-1358(+)
MADDPDKLPRDRGCPLLLRRGPRGGRRVHPLRHARGAGDGPDDTAGDRVRDVCAHHLPPVVRVQPPLPAARGAVHRQGRGAVRGREGAVHCHHLPRCLHHIYSSHRHPLRGVPHRLPSPPPGAAVAQPHHQHAPRGLSLLRLLDDRLLIPHLRIRGRGGSAGNGPEAGVAVDSDRDSASGIRGRPCRCSSPEGGHLPVPRPHAGRLGVCPGDRRRHRQLGGARGGQEDRGVLGGGGLGGAAHRGGPAGRQKIHHIQQLFRSGDGEEESLQHEC